MVLVLIAVGVALIISISFLHAQSTSIGLAENIDRRARARGIAESGLTTAFAYMKTNPGWRASMRHGTWVDEHDFSGGTFTIVGEDGEDTDGDGVVDGDRDLADDDGDAVTLTAIGRFDGASHSVRAVLSPVPPRKHLLMVVPDVDHLNVNDQRRVTQFEAWDFDVTLIDESDSQSVFDAAVARSDVAYITERVYSNNLNRKLRDAPIGVVCEEGYLNDDFGIATGHGLPYSGWPVIEVTDDDHFITSTLGLGVHRLTNDWRSRLVYISGTLAANARVPAERPWDGRPVLATLDVDDPLANGGVAAGRRVALPWGGSRFNWSSLTPEAMVIAERALLWGSEPQISGKVAHWTLDDRTDPVARERVSDADGVYRNGVTLNQSNSFFDDPVVAFDGWDDHIEVPHNDALLLNEGSLVFWFRTDEPSRIQGLVSKDSSGYDTGGHLSVWTQNQRVILLLQSTRRSYYMWSGRIRENAWHHVAFTFGSNGMKLYLDGALADSDKYKGGLGPEKKGIGNYEPMTFGVLTSRSGDRTTAGWSDAFSGEMNDVFMLDRVMSAEEIAELARTPSYTVAWTERP